MNNRSMEVFRPLDGLAVEVAACSPRLAEWRKFVYCESLTGRVFGEVDHFQVGLPLWSCLCSGSFIYGCGKSPLKHQFFHPAIICSCM